MSLKLRRFEDKNKKKIMIDDKTWLIDDVLDPSSAFWKYKDKYEIDSLLSRISPLQTDGLFRITKQDHVLDQFSEFVDFFSSLTKEQLNDYVEYIEDNEIDIMSDQVWRMLTLQDQRELFTKDPDIFDLWWSSLHHSEIEYYMTRIVDNKRLIKPAETLDFIRKLTKLSSKTKKKNLKYYPLPAGKFLTVQLIGDKLAISSKDSKKLEDVKELLVSRGNYFLEERTKIGPHGDTIFTYLFLTKNV
tara:strand:- start:196 stop:930 length:735 start_codon:yes stop_codon:yes gene_type:complete